MDSDTESGSASPPSVSPTASPVASFNGPPSLERIINHYVAAKRSLSATNYILRANELITKSRVVLEEIAILSARNAFGRRCVDEQIDDLYTIRDEVQRAAAEQDSEFRSTVHALDAANDRLQQILTCLRQTFVEPSLHDPPTTERDEQSQASGHVSQDDQPNGKTLYDFIDESKHTEIQDTLRNHIDAFNEARTEIEDNINSFSNTLQILTDMLSEQNPQSDPVLKPTLYDEPPPTTAQLFHGMEDHAAEMANLLQSLVSHYDLCVSALRHTEGGGEAARQASQSEELGKHVPGIEESWYRRTAPESMSEEERGEMLRVLENDSMEVEDVTIEIRDRNREQESLWDQLSQTGNKARGTRNNLRQVLELLREMRDIHLPSHMHAFATFQNTWTRMYSSFTALTDELSGYSEFYSTFLASYSQLLREVERREKAEAQMKKVAEKARRDLQKLYESDTEARRDFMDEVGRFLPTDLWPGLNHQATRWSVEHIVSKERC